MLIRALQNLLPLRCELCQTELQSHNKDLFSSWCQTCNQSLTRHARCLCCGLPTLEDMENCGRCLLDPPAWQKLSCVDAYEFPFDKLLHRFKYQGQFWLAKNLAALLAKEITEPASLLVPVPMHWRRQIVRGYNHSHLLALQLAKLLQVECNANSLIRNRHTKQQQGLTRKARLSNLKNAFSLEKPLPKHIALIDDVVTTGSTLTEICKLLKKNKVEQIDVYCIARSFGMNNN